MGLFVLMPSPIFFFKFLSSSVFFFQKPCFVPNLHNAVTMLSTFHPSPCYSGRSNYFLMLLSFLKLHGKVSGLIISNTMKQWDGLLWLINLFLGERDCRHCIRFWLRKKKKRFPMEFFKKENGDRFKINSPIIVSVMTSYSNITRNWHTWEQYVHKWEIPWTPPMARQKTSWGEEGQSNGK